MGSLVRQREYPKARALIVCAGRASFYDTAAPLSPIPAGLLAGPFRLAGAGQMGRPQIPAAGAREPLGLRAAPGRAPCLVAAGKGRRGLTAPPHLPAGGLSSIVA